MKFLVVVTPPSIYHHQNCLWINCYQQHIHKRALGWISIFTDAWHVHDVKDSLTQVLPHLGTITIHLGTKVLPHNASHVSPTLTHPSAGYHLPPPFISTYTRGSLPHLLSQSRPPSTIFLD